ncbi:NAD-dependent epimerase/dehydratase family protein [Cobetia marina]
MGSSGQVATRSGDRSDGVCGGTADPSLAAGESDSACRRADPGNTERLAALKALEDSMSGKLRVFASDLLEQGSYAEAMAGCAVVFHTASPFVVSVEDPERDLVRPAVEGTRNVLQEANRQSSVERVVLTSSCAAIYSDNADALDTPRGCFDESVWNTTASLTHQAYSHSKTLAEQAAWQIASSSRAGGWW